MSIKQFSEIKKNPQEIQITAILCKEKIPRQLLAFKQINNKTTCIFFVWKLLFDTLVILAIHKHAFFIEFTLPVQAQPISLRSVIEKLT